MEKTLNLTPESRTLKSRTVPIRIKKPLVLKKVEKAEAEQITWYDSYKNGKYKIS